MRSGSISTPAILTSIALGCSLAACGDDAAGPAATGSGASGGQGAAAAGGTGNGGAGALGGSGGDEVGGAGGGGGGVQLELDVLVRGTLFTSDLAEAQAYHDGLASAGEAPAKAAGDFGHRAMLGTDLLGTTQNELLALDRWSSGDNLDAFYSDPGFAEAFGALFASPPSFEVFERRFDWYGWGDLTSGDASDPHFFVVVRGRLAGEPDLIQPDHDAVASAGEDAALQAGDVAHVVFLGRDDAREFLAIDVWQSSDAIEAFYTNPDLARALGGLFESPPTLAVYASTNWYQW
jgi:quinol monooxygenase YgiN